VDQLIADRRPVLHLPGGDVDHQLGGLAEIAGALAALVDLSFTCGVAV
jgi:hypothetical protein